MIKESVDAAIAAEWARQANAGNNSSGSGQARGQVTALVVRECTFAGFMKCNPDNFRGTEGAVELRRWFEKTEMNFGIHECAEDKKVKFVAATQIAKDGKRVVELEPESMKIDAYIRGLSDNIKGEVTSSMPTNLNEAVLMAHKLMEQKLQVGNERILEGNKRKWENFQSGNNHFLYVSAVLLAMLVNVRSSATNVERLGTKRGHTRNRCPKKVKQEEVGETRGRAYTIKDVESQGLNVVTGMFLLNNRYASVLFDSGSDRIFMDTRFSSMLDIDPVI
ncbi:hypothetical protein Tco_0569633 [Tanacetum coccineum]